jgi:hypothetical protein
MKLKLFSIALLCFLFINRNATAAQIDGWGFSSTNLVAGHVFLNATGTTSVTFNVTADRATTDVGVNLQFALATKTTTGTVQLVSSAFAVTDNDFAGNLFANKSITTSISNSNVLNSTIYLAVIPSGATAYQFLGTVTFVVTNSSTAPSGTVSYNVGGVPSYVAGPDLSSSTIIHTSSSVPALKSGQSLFSGDHTTQLVLQTDGNLVVYQVSTGKALWASKTNTNQAKYLFFQGDGNLVLTKTTDLSTVVWASNIYADGGNEANAQYAIYVLQGDGNLVMMEDSKYSYIPKAGYYISIGDTGSGNFTVSPHFSKIN